MSKIFKAECEFEEIVIICPGPSLTKAQCDLVFNAAKTTIVVGNAWRYAPYADILYHCDEHWWNYHKGVPGFAGDLKLSLEPTKFSDVYRVERSPLKQGFDEAPRVVTGKNSGYQALGLAVHFKPKKIILLGYDMKSSPGRHNIDGDHPKEIKRAFAPSAFIPFYNSGAVILENKGIKVYNCTLDSALDCFEKRNLLDVL